jgi:type II secretory pathway pseudopilin PulG
MEGPVRVGLHAIRVVCPRRTRIFAGVLVLLGLLAAVAALLAVRSTRRARAAEQRARTALARSAVQEGERSLGAGNQNEALAYFARALRIDGSFEPARGWISDLLLRGRFSTVALHHEGAVSSAAFSPDGRWVVTASWDKTARVWETLIGSREDSPLLAEIAEVISGYEVTESGTLQPAQNSVARLYRLHEIADRAELGGPTVASFLKWFFSPPGERTISPGFRAPVCDFLQNLIKAGRSDEADDEFPGHDRFRRQQ